MHALLIGLIKLAGAVVEAAGIKAYSVVDCPLHFTLVDSLLFDCCRRWLLSSLTVELGKTCVQHAIQNMAKGEQFRFGAQHHAGDSSAYFNSPHPVDAMPKIQRMVLHQSKSQTGRGAWAMVKLPFAGTVWGFYTVSKMHQLWNGIAQNYKDQFWWHLAEIFKVL